MNYIQVDRALKDDPRVYPAGLDGFGVIITLGLIAAEKYAANGFVAPPFSAAIHVARHANTDAARAAAALTSLKAHGAISGDEDTGWMLAEDLWTMFAGRAIAERDRKRKQRRDQQPAPPLRTKSPGQSGKSAGLTVTPSGVPGTDEGVPGQSGDGCPTNQPSNHPSNRHNNVGWTDSVGTANAPHPEGHAEGAPPPCGRCKSVRPGGLLYRVLDGESWDDPTPAAWEVACCPDCTGEGSIFKTDMPEVGMVPLPDADGEDWVPRSGTPAAKLTDYAADAWANDVRKQTRARLTRKR